MAGKILPYEGIWTREEVAADKDNLYVYGDNTVDRISGYVPKTTQAVIRGLPNAISLITKKDRYLNSNSFFTDDDFDEYCSYLHDRFLVLETCLKCGKNIYVPVKDGQVLIGTGKADLPNKAPKCYLELCKKFNFLFRYYGEKYE